MVGASGPIAIFGRSPHARPPQRVLLLESGRETAQYLSTLIRMAGHQCETVSTVQPAIEWVGRRDFDLAFLNLAIPAGGAIALSQTLRQSRPRLGLVALNHGPNVWDDRTLEHLGFSRSLEKPYSVRDILDILESMDRNARADEP
jgi:DNA-binding response OmpR family regulator